jgi:hypothetical protein
VLNVEKREVPVKDGELIAVLLILMVPVEKPDLKPSTMMTFIAKRTSFMENPLKANAFPPVSLKIKALAPGPLKNGDTPSTFTPQKLLLSSKYKFAPSEIPVDLFPENSLNEKEPISVEPYWPSSQFTALVALKVLKVIVPVCAEESTGNKPIKIATEIRKNLGKK